MFKVIIDGGEKMGDYNFFLKKCAFFLREKGKSGEGITIYSTGDKFIEEFAERYGISVQYYYCDWDKYPKDALLKRQDLMLSTANGLIVFDNKTKQQYYLCKKAKELNIPVKVVEYEIKK